MLSDCLMKREVHIILYSKRQCNNKPINIHVVVKYNYSILKIFYSFSREVVSKGNISIFLLNDVNTFFKLLRRQLKS